MFMTVHYRQHDVRFKQDGCVLRSNGVGSDNHVEVRINSTGMKVYASDPGKPATTRLIAHARFHVPLTRALIWIEDVHYNGDKFNHQQSNSFSWTTSRSTDPSSRAISASTCSTTGPVGPPPRTGCGR
jgi:hypothetical protein